MTRESIIKSCKKNKLYLTPHLNDVLYLHYQGKHALFHIWNYLRLCNYTGVWIEPTKIFKFFHQMFKFWRLDALTPFLFIFKQHFDSQQNFRLPTNWKSRWIYGTEVFVVGMQCNIANIWLGTSTWFAVFVFAQ